MVAVAVVVAGGRLWGGCVGVPWALVLLVAVVLGLSGCLSRIQGCGDSNICSDIKIILAILQHLGVCSLSSELPSDHFMCNVHARMIEL